MAGRFACFGQANHWAFVSESVELNAGSPGLLIERFTEQVADRGVPKENV